MANVVGDFPTILAVPCDIPMVLTEEQAKDVLEEIRLAQERRKTPEGMEKIRLRKERVEKLLGKPAVSK